MTRQLKNAKISYVSYVDKAANQHTFFLTKSDSQPTFQHPVTPVFKADDPQKLVYGIVYEPSVEDSQGDYMDASDIEKAAHGFMESYQHIDKQHDFETKAGKVVESYVAPVDIEIGDTTITKGTWVLVTKATDEIWDAIQKGDYTGYSMAGTAETIEKAVQQRYEQQLPMQQAQLAFEALSSVFSDIRWNGQYADNESKIAALLNEIDEFKGVISSIKGDSSLVTKQSKKGLVNSIKSFLNKEGDDEMTQEEITKAVQAAMAPFTEKLEKVEKAVAPATAPAAPDPKNPNSDKKEDSVDSDVVTKAVATAVAPLQTRLEKLEKARTSNVPDVVTTTSVEKNAAPSYVDAAFPINE